MNFRENIPTITGPGAFFIALVYISLLLTSQLTRNFLFDNWSITIGLVAISIPLSVFFNQIYHSYLIMYGFKKKPFHKIFNLPSKYNYTIDTMLDYFCFEDNNEHTQKLWFILQKRSTAYNFMTTLLFLTILYLILYLSVLIYYIIQNSMRNLCLFNNFFIIGIIIVISICLFFIWIFYKSTRSLWNTYMLLEKKLLDTKKDKIEEWLIEEGILHKNDDKD